MNKKAVESAKANYVRCDRCPTEARVRLRKTGEVSGLYSAALAELFDNEPCGAHSASEPADARTKGSSLEISRE